MLEHAKILNDVGNNVLDLLDIILKNKLNYWLNHKQRKPKRIICGLVLFLGPNAAQIRLLLVLSKHILNAVLEAYASIHLFFLVSTNASYTVTLGPTLSIN